MNNRNPSIDLIKFFAVFLIINSHMDMMYPKFSILATGGAIGDVLFLFCSGFTLFKGRMDRFDNWYKRRINRIYPTVFAYALITSIFFNSQLTMKDILLKGGGEFVFFIMIYYIILYAIRKWCMGHLKLVYLVLGALIIVVYVFFFPYKEETGEKGMYGITSYFRWIPFFFFMLLGAHIGSLKKEIKFSFSRDFIKILICIITFYSFQFLAKKVIWIAPYQIFTLLPLFGIVFYFYKLCNTPVLSKFYNLKYAHSGILSIAGLCLESYLIQFHLFTTQMNNIFPLNLVIMVIYILCVSYLMRCLSRLFSQTFNTENYRWKEIFKMY